jgi:uncharacterized SAM-binding protein YcdF (DUF218 family)
VLFVVDKVFNILARPAELALATLIAALGLLILGGRRSATGLLAVIALVGIALELLPLDDWLLAPLEARFPRPVTLPRCLAGVLLLGGGEDRRATTAWGTPILSGDFGSFLEVARLARAYPKAEILFSGYGTDSHPMVTEAAIARQILESLGVAPARIRLEERSRDTWQNLVYSQALVQPRRGQVWVLVGAAAHLPRSVAIARHLGWDLVPDPTSYLSAPVPGGPQADFARKLDNLGVALHEWEGLLGYRLEGRTDTLLPAAEPPVADGRNQGGACTGTP